MSSAPDWKDGDCCFRCRTQFTLVARKHHCRNCGEIFCSKCSSHHIPLPKLNIEKPARVCNVCYEKIVKEDGNLALALDLSKNSEQSTASSSSSRKNSSSTNKSKSGNKSGASAPSEEELKLFQTEEEELQLAIALSLGETVTSNNSKPLDDSKQFRLGAKNNNQTTPRNNRSDTPIATNNSKITIEHKPKNDNSQTYSSPSCQTNDQPKLQVQPIQHLDQVANKDISYDIKPSLNEALSEKIQSEHYEFNDNELFKFVADATSTAEIFINRVQYKKSKNKPLENDSAIQSLFNKVSNMQTKLLTEIEKHEKERANFESLQEKITQISDARAALDALREEHKEEMQQREAEAERLRHSQLTAKLEMMRQKKAQMMQYQKEVALQRIQEKEAQLNGSFKNEINVPIETVVPIATVDGLTTTSYVGYSDAPMDNALNYQHSHNVLHQQHQQPVMHQQPISMVHQPPMVVYQPHPMQQHSYSDLQRNYNDQLHSYNDPQHTHPQTQLIHTHQMQLSHHQLGQQQQHGQQQPQMPPKVEEALLISFDD